MARERWARAPLSRERKYTPGTFSFNVAGGRCDVCEGAGVTKVEMYFLADLSIPCEACGGRRYRPEVLEVRVHGLSMDELLDRTIENAIAHKPKGHDFVIDRRHQRPALSRHMSVTGG